jgi:hypothetical protein
MYSVWPVNPNVEAPGLQTVYKVKVNVKIKLYLCLIMRHAMKTYGGVDA